MEVWDMVSDFWKNYESNFLFDSCFTITSNRWGDMQTMQGVASSAQCNGWLVLIGPRY